MNDAVPLLCDRDAEYYTCAFARNGFNFQFSFKHLSTLLHIFETIAGVKNILIKAFAIIVYSCYNMMVNTLNKN